MRQVAERADPACAWRGACRSWLAGQRTERDRASLELDGHRGLCQELLACSLVRELGQARVEENPLPRRRLPRRRRREQEPYKADVREGAVVRAGAGRRRSPYFRRARETGKECELPGVDVARLRRSRT